MTNQIKPFAKHLKRYLRAYGGWMAVFGSPLFLTSLVVTSLSYSNWLTQDWMESTKSLLPNLLGFSLGSYSIIFSLVTSRIKRAMKASLGSTGVSRLEEVNATFFHFIFVQVIALLWAFLYQGTAITDTVVYFSHSFPFGLKLLKVARIGGSFIGYLLLIYSFILVIGSALAVYRLALIVDPKDD